MQLRNRDDRRFEWIDDATDQSMQGAHDRRGGKDGVGPELRHRRVTAAPRHDDLEHVGGRHHRARPQADAADRQAGPVMHAVHCGYGKFFEQALLNHHSAAGLVLFGRLEDEAHGAPKPARLGQVAGGTEQHRRVPIVAAGVHLAGPRRAMREVVALFQRQRVHVGAQTDRGTLADA